MPRFIRIVEPPVNGWTEFYIQRRLVHHFPNMKYIALNMRCCWEMDFFSLRPSGYSEEIEIKTTLTDFKADKKKGAKHCRYLQTFRGRTITELAPNRFSFAVPHFLGITPKDVPDYAGLYIVRADGIVVCEKWPPFLHKQKQNWDRKVAKSTSFRLLDARGYYDTE